MKRKTGWFKEPKRHALAAKGIKTAIKPLQKNMELQGRIKLDDDRRGGRFSLSNKGVKDESFDIRGKARMDNHGNLTFRYKQNHLATSIRGPDGKPIDAKTAELATYRLQQILRGKGIRFDSDWKNDYKKWKTSQFRRIESDNEFTQTGRKTNVLGWDDWVEVNNAFNKVFDMYGLKGNISTLGGKFKVREGRDAYTEDDWEGLRYENVGSIMQPVTREDYIRRR